MSPNTMNKTTKIKRAQTDPIAELEALRENAERVRANADALAEQAARLEKSLRLAKGTKEIRQRVIDPARPFYVGPDAPTEWLYDAVKRAITGPDVRSAKTLRELGELTGETNRNRIGGALIKFQVDGLKVKNVGTKYRALWHLQGK